MRCRLRKFSLNWGTAAVRSGRLLPEVDLAFGHMLHVVALDRQHRTYLQPTRDTAMLAHDKRMACLMTSRGFLAIREPLPGTPNMPGSGGGRIENGSAVAGRAVV